MTIGIVTFLLITGWFLTSYLINKIIGTIENKIHLLVIVNACLTISLLTIGFTLSLYMALIAVSISSSMISINQVVSQLYIKDRLAEEMIELIRLANKIVITVATLVGAICFGLISIKLQFSGRLL